VFAFLFLEKLLKNLAKERNYSLRGKSGIQSEKTWKIFQYSVGLEELLTHWDPCTWEVSSEHLSTSHLLNFEVLIISITL